MGYLHTHRGWTGIFVALLVTALAACTSFKAKEDSDMASLRRELRQIKISHATAQETLQDVCGQLQALEAKVEGLGGAVELSETIRAVGVAAWADSSFSGVPLFMNTHPRELNDCARLIRSLQARLDPRLYNGASLVGLQGIVIKSHGSADSFAFQNALRTALVEIEKGVPRQIGELLAKQTVLERAG